MDALLSNIAVLGRAADADDKERVAPLVETGDHEGQALLPSGDRIAESARGDEIAQGVNDPQREPGERRRMGEDGQVGPLLEHGEAKGAQRLDRLLVEERRALADDRAVQRHAELERRA